MINHDKTEQYIISRTGSEDWKKCKLLGSCLGTPEDIKRRKVLAISAAKNLKPLFSNKKIWTPTKSRLFDAYISSVFLYNASTWTLTQTLENQIDAFQRKMIRINVLNVKWPKKMSNLDTYRLSRIQPWSVKIKKQRMNWFGHVARMHPDTPAKKALAFARAEYKKPRGRPKERWIDQMNKQLDHEFNLSWEEGENLAANRATWRQLVKGKYG